MKKRDTPGQIAEHYRVDVGDLMQANGIDDPRHLAVGRVLRIPTGGEAQRRTTRKPPARAGAKAGHPPGAPLHSQAAAPSAPTPRAEVDEALARAQSAFDTADFETALAAADRARVLLPRAGQDIGDRSRLARAYVLRGMAQVGLGRDDEARTSFRKALEFDRALELDPEHVSPKIVEAFREARER